MEKEDEGIVSERMGRVMKAVAGWILQSNYYEWKKYKHRCQEYKINMSPDGTEHNLRLANIVDPVFWPIARASGMSVIPFTEERIIKLLEPIKNNKDWIKETNRLHKDITKDTDKNLVVHISKKK